MRNEIDFSFKFSRLIPKEPINGEEDIFSSNSEKVFSVREKFAWVMIPAVIVPIGKIIIISTRIIQIIEDNDFGILLANLSYNGLIR